jgi:hypothetical protein
MMRDQYPTTQILVRGELQRSTLLAKVNQIPLDEKKPIEVIIREWSKPRKPDQNALMWAGTLKDIATQAYVNGRTYSAEIWHEHFKERFLPEEFMEGITKDGYKKWDVTPSGKRILVGSSTHLTVKGFALYLTEIESFAATELGVQFGVQE